MCTMVLGCICQYFWYTLIYIVLLPIEIVGCSGLAIVSYHRKDNHDHWSDRNKCCSAFLVLLGMAVFPIPLLMMFMYMVVNCCCYVDCYNDRADEFVDNFGEILRSDD